MRYSISGANSSILSGTVAATGGTGIVGDPTALMAGVNLLGQNIPSGRTLYLRSFWALNGTAASNIHLFDATAGSNATDSSRKVVIPCASDSLTQVEFPAPGLKFSTGCCVCKDATSASGAFTPGAVGGNGYFVG